MLNCLEVVEMKSSVENNSSFLLTGKVVISLLYEKITLFDFIVSDAFFIL